MHRSDAKLWREAELDEKSSHDENKTFGPATTLPAGFRALKASFVYKIKRGGRYKVRVVIKGYQMVAGIDYNQTFAPVAKATTIRLVLAKAARLGLRIRQADIKTAFLAADMDTEVYVHLPAGFHDGEDCNPHDEPSKTVHRLLRGVPGIPQGSHLFNKRFREVLESLGFRRCPDDHCLYRIPDVLFYLVVYFDDVIYVYAPVLQERADQ
ncbi:MAG: reverse transcriptase domain-containing protein, partial [bacterium]